MRRSGKMKDGEGAADKKVWKERRKNDWTIFYLNLTHEHQ